MRDQRINQFPHVGENLLAPGIVVEIMIKVARMAFQIQKTFFEIVRYLCQFAFLHGIHEDVHRSYGIADIVKTHGSDLGHAGFHRLANQFLLGFFKLPGPVFDHLLQFITIR